MTVEARAAGAAVSAPAAVGLRYGSVCSGIEAASLAWEPLGWTPAWFSEVDPFASAVLAHRFPHVPNHGDFTQIGKGFDVQPIDVLVGGTPCQSFSVAGKRAGLDDPRGNLTLEFLALAGRLRPEWVVWENVPGVLSDDGGRTFGTVLGLLGKLGYGFAYAVLDAQFFGVAQRRRRVFVVGCAGGQWQRAAAVLLEPESLRGNPAPRRSSGQGATRTLTSGSGGGRYDKHPLTPIVNALCANMGQGNQFAASGQFVPVISINNGQGSPNASNPGDAAFTLAADSHAAVLVPATSPALKARDYKGPSSDGDGDGACLVPVAFAQNSRDEVRLQGGDGSICVALGADEGMKQRTCIAFSGKDYGAHAGDIASTLRAMGHDGSHANAGGQVAVAFNWQNGGGYGKAHDGPGITEDGTGPVSASQVQAVARGMAVRRLTLLECERLQGMPDDWTAVPYRGKPAADGPRYRAIGNSMAVPVMAWIGARIQAIHGLA